MRVVKRTDEELVLSDWSPVLVAAKFLPVVVLVLFGLWFLLGEGIPRYPPFLQKSAGLMLTAAGLVLVVVTPLSSKCVLDRASQKVTIQTVWLLRSRRQQIPFQDIREITVKGMRNVRRVVNYFYLITLQGEEIQIGQTAGFGAAAGTNVCEEMNLYLKGA